MSHPTCTKPDALVVRLRGWWHPPQCFVVRFTPWEYPPGFPWCTCTQKPALKLPDQQPTWT